MRSVILSHEAPAPPRYYSQAVKANGMVYVAGNCGNDPKDGSFVPGTVGDRTVRALQNIELVLKEVGLDLTDIVTCTIFLSNYTEDFQAMNAAYVTCFPEGHGLPARACVGVKDLPGNTDVEIQCIAASRN